MVNLALAVWDALPVWIWGAILAALIAISIASALEFWPIIRGFIKTFVGMVPWDKWQTWALIGAAVAIFGAKVWLDLHDQALLAGAAEDRKKAVAARDTYWKGLIKDSNDAYDHKLAGLQQWIDEHLATEAARVKALEEQAARDRDKAKRAGDELEKRRTENVTKDALAVCPDVPRGIVLQFNGGAAYANGGDNLAVAAAAASGGFPASSPSGVSLDIYSRAVDGTQRAYRSCRKQVTDWQQYYDQVIDPALETAEKVIAQCTPKGASP